MRFVSLAVARPVYRLLSARSVPTKAETFHWTSPAKEASVVETDRQIDLCSEHANARLQFRARGGASARLGASDQEVDGGNPGHRSTGRRDGGPAPMRIARHRCHLTALDDASLGELRCGCAGFSSAPPRATKVLEARRVASNIANCRDRHETKRAREAAAWFMFAW